LHTKAGPFAATFQLQNPLGSPLYCLLQCLTSCPCVVAAAAVQANCCEYLDSDNNWVGCQLASNLYTCTYQFEEKPINVCCY
jgi:hypothetical protein